MSPLTLLIIGFLVAWIGLSNSLASLKGVVTGSAKSGYTNLTLNRLIFGGLFAALPLALLKSESDKQKYVALILASFLLTNSKSVSKFAGEFSALAKG